MRGIQLPEIGGVRDTLLTRMFMMEELRQADFVNTIGNLLVAAVGPTDTSVANVRKVLDNYRISVAYGRFSNAYRAEIMRKEKTDEDLLKMVEKLGSK